MSIDPIVIASLANIRQDETGKRVNFEDTVAYLAPSYPMLSNANKKKKTLPNANISSTAKLNGNVKPGYGKTGVDLCYYPYKEFNQLPEK